MVFVKFDVVCRTKNDVVMYMFSINMRGNNIRIFPFQYPVCKLFSNLMGFLITHFAGGKSLYQMIGFVAAAFPAMVERIFEVNCCGFGGAGISGNENTVISFCRIADVGYCFING